MTASVKTPLNTVMHKTPALTSVQVAQTSKPTIKTNTVKQKLGRENECGCLWAKTPLNGGEEYMTGEFVHNGEKVNVVVMRNGYKSHDKMPDWRIYLDTKFNVKTPQNTSDADSPNTDNTYRVSDQDVASL